MTAAERFPLSWPIGWKRTEGHRRQRAAFRSRGSALTMHAAIQRLSGETDRLGARSVILSTNVETRLDGLPRSGQAAPRDPGAALYFDLKAKPHCLACDRWTRVEDNVAAIAQHIDALRRIDRYGVGTMEQAFAGYAALPPTEVDWRIVLGVTGSFPTREQVQDAHRELAKQHHPDRGGDANMMAKLNAARDVAMRELAR